LHALEWGRRDSGRVVVCAHGYSGNARDFDFLAHELSQRSRVICPDVAGRGDSAWLASPLAYHFGQFLADFRSLLVRVGAKEVDWIGTSMGGLLGMLLASQPGSPIRSLVMNDVGAYVPLDALQHIGHNLAAPDRFDTLAEVEAHLRRTHRDWGEITEEQWAHLVRHGARRTEDGYRLHYDPRIARVMQPMPFAPGLFFWDAWYRVRCPVLLIRGERSEVFPASVASTMLAVKPGAQFAEIAGAGHAPALMSSGEIALVRDFVFGTGADRSVSRNSAAPSASPTHAY
jgi:pimeloyl-ACP methyl ester carboxylesterase